jgi:hypothetical protein
MTDIKSLSPVITQLVERKLGMYASSYLGNDIYFLLEAINILISSVGEAEVKKELESRGKTWESFIEKLNLLNKLSIQVKIFYDPIQDKKFDKKEENKVQEILKKYFIKSASRMAVMQRDIYDIFVFLVDITSIKNKSITSDAFKIIEHSGTGKFDMTQRRQINREGIPPGGMGG